MNKLEIIRLFPGVDSATISLLPVLDQFHEGTIIADGQGVVLYVNDTQAMIDDLTQAIPDLPDRRFGQVPYAIHDQRFQRRQSLRLSIYHLPIPLRFN